MILCLSFEKIMFQSTRMIIVLARGTEHEASILRLRGIVAHAILARRLVIGDNGWKLETLGDGQKSVPYLELIIKKLERLNPSVGKYRIRETET